MCGPEGRDFAGVQPCPPPPPAAASPVCRTAGGREGRGERKGERIDGRGQEEGRRRDKDRRRNGAGRERGTCSVGLTEGEKKLDKQNTIGQDGMDPERNRPTEQFRA